MDTIAQQIDRAARDFIDAAWTTLLRERVVPPPNFRPWLAVGRDFYGPELMTSELDELEKAIQASHPRFSEDVPLHERDFANAYSFPFLSTCIARITRSRDEFSVTHPAITASIDDLKRALEDEAPEVATCRIVSHMTTLDGSPLEVAGLTIVPITADNPRHGQRLHEIIESVIEGSSLADPTSRESVYDPPESVIIARERGDNPFDTSDRLSSTIQRFMTAVRLIHAGTTESFYEIRAETNPVRRLTPDIVRFRGAGPGLMTSSSQVRRTVRLSNEDSARFTGLADLLSKADKPREGMVFRSLAMAMQKFTMSYHAHNWHEQLVDLATAFEASMSGTSKSDVTLRLKTRAAALLASDRDAAASIFNDIGHVYGLRSSLVHGANMTEKELLKRVRAISTVPKDEMFGPTLSHAVDRLRDLVRRSILVRIALAAGDDPLWPLDTDRGVDASLSDDETKAIWRSSARAVLSAIDCGAALDLARPAVDGLSPEDR
jgi:hypothetical protein